jgi:energy-converting hydrogenase Eha subunit F
MLDTLNTIKLCHRFILSSMGTVQSIGLSGQSRVNTIRIFHPRPIPDSQIMRFDEFGSRQRVGIDLWVHGGGHFKSPVYVLRCVELWIRSNYLSSVFILLFQLVHHGTLQIVGTVDCMFHLGFA